MKLEVTNYSCVFFWFNAAIIFIRLDLFANILAMCIHTVDARCSNSHFAFDSDNIYIAQLMLFNWILMIEFIFFKLMWLLPHNLVRQRSNKFGWPWPVFHLFTTVYYCID